MQYPFQNKDIALTPLAKSDYQQIYNWHSDLRNLHLWQVDRDVRNYDDFVDDFERRLRRNIDFYFIIRRRDDGKPVGVIYNYNASIVDQTCYLCVFLQADFTHTGMGTVASELFLRHLFHDQAIRKVYIEVFGYNEKVVRLARMKGFEQEGKLKEHRWYGNRYWDLNILAITRSEFTKRYPPTLD